MERMSRWMIVLLIAVFAAGAIYNDYLTTKDCATFGKFKSGTNVYRCKIVEPK